MGVHGFASMTLHLCRIASCVKIEWNTYQFFIPGMRGEDVTVVGYADANSRDNAEIKRLLGITRLPGGPNDLGWRR